MTTSLEEFGKKLRARKPDWQPLDLTTLREGVWLAADPSLTALGLVLFENTLARGPVVHLAKSFKTEQGEQSGYEDVLQRTEILEIQLQTWSQNWVLNTDWGDVHLVQEAPPIGGLRHSKFEISLITGYAFRRAFRQYPRYPMVRRQDHANLICGDQNAKKPVVHAELKKLYPDIRGAADWITNEATRDALCVALYAAKRGGKALP